MFKKTRLKAAEKIKLRQKSKQLQAEFVLTLLHVDRKKTGPTAHYVVSFKRGSKKDNAGFASVSSDTHSSARESLSFSSVLFERSTGDQKTAVGSTAGIAFHSKELTLALREGSAPGPSSSSSSTTASSSSGKERKKKEPKKGGGTLLGIANVDLAQWVGTSGKRRVQVDFDNDCTLHGLLKVTWLKYKGKLVVNANPEKGEAEGSGDGAESSEGQCVDGFDDLALVTEADHSGSDEELDTTMADDMTGMQTEDDSESEMGNDFGEEMSSEDPFANGDADDDYRRVVRPTEDPLFSQTALCTICWKRIPYTEMDRHLECSPSEPDPSLLHLLHPDDPRVRHLRSSSQPSSLTSSGFDPSFQASSSASNVSSAYADESKRARKAKETKEERKARKEASKQEKLAAKQRRREEKEAKKHGEGEEGASKPGRVRRLSMLFTHAPLMGMASASGSSDVGGAEGSSDGTPKKKKPSKKSSRDGGDGEAGGSDDKKSSRKNREKRGSILGSLRGMGSRRSSKSKGSASGGYFQGMMPLIVDHGSGAIKAGFLADATPRFVQTSIIGVPRMSSVRTTTGSMLPLKECYVGQAALAKRGLLALSYPIKSGIVQNWDHVQKIWESMYQEFDCKSREHPVLITQPPLNPRASREKIAEIFFETFQIPALCIASPGFLALTGSGRTTGVVLDVGDGVAHAVSIYEGTPITHSVCRTDLAGRDLTEHLISLLMENGQYSFTSSSERDIVRQIKEKFGYVAERFDAEMHLYQTSSSKNVCYTLPDGQTIIVGNERFRCAEPLFKPPLLGREHGGVQHLLYNSITKSDPDIWKELFQNIVLSGGTTNLPGFEPRLQHELAMVAPVGTKMRFISQSDRSTSTWVGAKTWLSSITPSSADAIWLSAQDYQEEGSNIIHRYHLML